MENKRTKKDNNNSAIRKNTTILKSRSSIVKTAIILGTRPEIIKMSPVIRECELRGFDHFVLHTGQHYSYEMDRLFFEELELPAVKYNLDVGSGPHGRQTGKMLAGIEEILVKEKPGVVLVEGDTNTVLAGALAASKLHIKIGHVEAGLRSFDRRMPEETNRVLTDRISDYLFAPTEISRQNLLAEGLPDKRIYVTGNTIVDAVYQNIEIAKSKVDVLSRLGLNKKEYFIATAHREENVDNPLRLKGILGGFELVYQEFGLPVVFPVHPRTLKRMQEFGFEIPEGALLIEPLGYLEFLLLEANASLALTDSDGVQEEACILGVPCVTLRDNTERPETVEVGANVVVGCDCFNIATAVHSVNPVDRNWTNPYGDGMAAENIMKIIS